MVLQINIKIFIIYVFGDKLGFIEMFARTNP